MRFIHLLTLVTFAWTASAVDFVALRGKTHVRGFADGRAATFGSAVDLGTPTDVAVAVGGTSVLVLTGRDLYALGVSSGGADLLRRLSSLPTAMCVGPMGPRLLTAQGVIDATEQVLLPGSALPAAPVALAEGRVGGESYLVVAGTAELASYRLEGAGYVPVSRYTLPAPARDVAYAGWTVPMVVVATDVTRGYILPYFEEAPWFPGIPGPVSVDWSCDRGSGNCPVMARDGGDVLRTISSAGVAAVVGHYPGIGEMASTTGMLLEEHTVVANDGTYLDMPTMMPFGRSSSGGGYTPLYPPTLAGIAGEGNRMDSGDFLGVDAEGMAGDGVVDFVVASYSREGRATANPMVTAYDYDPTLPSGSRWVKKAGFNPYGDLRFGATVSLTDLEGSPGDELLTGPGPGPVFGPHVKGFRQDASSIAKINFYAYGTLKYGVNVAGPSVAQDRTFLTGAGPGAVFAPHVRGWDVSSGALRTVSKVNFFAFPSPYNFGAEVHYGDGDNDGYNEILAGAGPAPGNEAWVRGFNYDNVAVTPIPQIDYRLSARPVQGGADIPVSYGARPAWIASFSKEIGIAHGPDPGVQDNKLDLRSVTGGNDSEIGIGGYLGCYKCSAFVDGNGR